ncbi:MAG TPA: hypothetical protein VH988_04140 [Thermoanaerobaculia bacterium]|jgi:hypothetical protein|nr:hypothetical protein [Thermoanaerobaculia bacterium]
MAKQHASLALEGLPADDGQVREADFLRDQWVHQGFIRGKLEAINLHGSANVFEIYPHAGPSRVNCHFPSVLVKEAVGAVNRYVEIHGTLRYRTNDSYPFAVEVSRIVTLEDEEDMPTFDELLGSAPNLTDGTPAEDWVAHRRLEQEEELLALLGEQAR